ncbi:MAG: hypothetical protein SO141_04060 [Alphaproteobacteria bacterium]|nr:hypothetical protein [Alphaproteobacteria bacterium]
MTVFQIFIGLLIMSSMIIRPFLYKPAAKLFPAEMSAAFTSTWLMLGLAVTFPIFGHLLTDNFNQTISSPYLLLSVAKGLLLWWLIKLQQIVNKESTSSSVFFGFIALALGSLANNLFFNEGLKIFQLVCICGFGILGVLFMLKGDARRLSVKGQISFWLIVLFAATFSVTDHLAIPRIGWYPHLLFSSAVMFGAALLHGISNQDFKNIFRDKNLAVAGAFYVVSEFLIIYSSINLLPVSFVAVFMRLAAPTVMVISALKYKEQSWQNQLIFGLAALALAVPLIFIKG